MDGESSAQNSGEREQAPSPQSDPVLEVLDLVKTYPNGRTVLNGVSFQVFPEETFVILGGSGCGKSTLLNILIGVLMPTSGCVRVFGQDLHRLNRAELKEVHVRCGMLFQSGALLESLSLLENVNLRLTSITEVWHRRSFSKRPGLNCAWWGWRTTKQKSLPESVAG